jgi:hypothetical protein
MPSYFVTVLKLNCELFYEKTAVTSAESKHSKRGQVDANKHMAVVKMSILSMLFAFF